MPEAYHSFGFRILTAAFCGHLLFVLWVGPTNADEPAAVDFEKQILPLLTRHCGDCHGPKDPESGLRIDRRVSLLRGGDLGLPAIVPGKPEQSLLVEAVQGEDADLRMPPEGELLAADEVALLTRWIAEGAVWPGQMEEVVDETVADHWSFQPVVRPVLPSDATGWARNPIDQFIAEKLHASGLGPSPRADRRSLIRRLSLVLTGLPPTPEEVRAFVEDETDFETAYSDVVERLLASPRYGERWAQHWLDIIRWAETVGFETNAPRPNAWHYRDWVIESLNKDKPYDRFLFEQLAGDTVGQEAALGFLVAGPANLPGQIGRDEEAMRQARQDELDEVIRTVSQAAFGLTIGCARCHNHKFDPITQRDYYSLQAIFAGLTYGDRRLTGRQNDEWTAEVPAVRRQLAEQLDRREKFRVQHQLQPSVRDVQTHAFEPILATAVRMKIEATGNGAAASLYEFEVWTAAAEGIPSRNVALAASGATPSASSFALANQTRHFDNLVDGSADRRQTFAWAAAQGGPAWIQVDLAAPTLIERAVWHSGYSVPASYTIEVQPADGGDWLTVADSDSYLPRIDDTRPADRTQVAGLPTSDVAEIANLNAAIRKTQQELARLEAGPQTYAARFDSDPDETWLLLRGDAMRRKKVVPPAVPTILERILRTTSNDTQFEQAASLNPLQVEQDRRLMLVRHLTSAAHPLTARVLVNRVWQHHFGVGLVSTPSDFGKMGQPPSHPELLDWLASEFVSQDWSLKSLHRLIVHSAAFQQSSAPRADALAVDADSRLLWRFPPRRLEAEAIRDSILFVSGKLNLEMGGPGFDFFEQRGGLADYTPLETFEKSGWRRMVYAHKIRMQAVDIFGSFDCPDAGQMKPRRTRSITPLQSLGLLNSPFAIRQAAYFAERLRLEHGGDEEACVNAAFELTMSRPAEPDEREQLLALSFQYGLQQVCRVLFNTSEFILIR